MSTTKLLELRPNRDLLDPNFNGYKLSLDKLPILEKEFQFPIERILPTSEQYSLLHAKLFGLQNFLFVDHFNSDSNTYFIDQNLGVQRILINEVSRLISGIEKVWELPKYEGEVNEKLNPGLFFVSETLVLATDGKGTLYILQTEDRKVEENTWTVLFKEKILQNEESFSLVDAIFHKNDTSNEIHCVLSTIEKNEEDEKFFTYINWVILSQTSDSKWGPVQFKVLKGGQFYYCALERDCKSIYIASDSSFKFILDSEYPIVPDQVQKEAKKIYQWSQNAEKLILKIKSPQSDVNSDLVNVISNPNSIEIKYDSQILLTGDLTNGIEPNLTTWAVTDDVLEVILTKSENGVMWSEIIKNDNCGEQIFDPKIVEEVHKKLAHLCSENEEISTETGPSFSSQQIEECDFANEELAIFERISRETHKVTHQINLGSIQYIATIKLAANEAPALVLRHDVDGCIWQPKSNNEAFKMEHEGTLLAFGYVQASKSQRKFLICSPQFSYSTICESSCHIFIYRQSKLVTSGELRNRHSGRRINAIAEQQLINIGDQEIFGIHATEEFLYLLLEKKILIIKIK